MGSIPTMDDYIIELKQLHTRNNPSTEREPYRCTEDKEVWPCAVQMLLEEIERLHQLGRIYASPVMGEVDYELA